MTEKFSLDVETSKKLVKHWFESQGKVVNNIKIHTLSNIDVELENSHDIISYTDMEDDVILSENWYIGDDE